METQKKLQGAGSKWENLKVPRELMNRLRENKKRTMVPVGKTAEAAINEYLNKKENGK